jgi:hypothetical protein
MFNIEVLWQRDAMPAIEEECARIRTIVSSDATALRSLAQRDPTTPWILPCLLNLLPGNAVPAHTRVDVLAILTLMAETSDELANALSEACALPLLVDLVCDDSCPFAVAQQAAVCMGELALGSPTLPSTSMCMME